MADMDATAWEDALIEDMRAHDGAVTTGPLAGHPLLVMTATGAKSGAKRRSILTYSRDGGDYMVAGSAGGSKEDPARLHNIEAKPEVSIEAGNTTFEAKASVVDGAERDRLWDQHVAALPHFADYPAQTGRIIPMVRLTPVG